MTYETYIAIYNLITDEMNKAGEELERICGEIAEFSLEPSSEVQKKYWKQIVKYKRRQGEMERLLENYEAEVKNPIEE